MLVKYQGMASTTGEYIWLKQLVRELGFKEVST